MDKQTNDMHVHTEFSMAVNSTVEELLKMAQERNLKYISFTDRENIKAYRKIESMTEKELKDLYDGNIVSGVEIACSYKDLETNQNYFIDIAGYNFTPDKFDIIEKWLLENTNKDKTNEFQKNQMEFFKQIVEKYGFIVDEEDMVINEGEFAGRKMGIALAKHSENFEIVNPETNNPIIPKEVQDQPSGFFVRCCNNQESPFYIDRSTFLPSIEDTSNFLHSVGADVCLVHSRAYHKPLDKEDNVKKSKEFVVNLLEYSKKYENDNDKRLIDGIEIIYGDFDIRTMVETSDESVKYDLFASGGTDYYYDKTGKNKGLWSDLGYTSSNSFHIPNQIIEEWAKPLDIHKLCKDEKEKDLEINY